MNLPHHYKNQTKTECPMCAAGIPRRKVEAINPANTYYVAVRRASEDTDNRHEFYDLRTLSLLLDESALKAEIIVNAFPQYVADNPVVRFTKVTIVPAL